MSVSCRFVGTDTNQLINRHPYNILSLNGGLVLKNDLESSPNNTTRFPSLSLVSDDPITGSFETILTHSPNMTSFNNEIFDLQSICDYHATIRNTILNLHRIRRIRPIYSCAFRQSRRAIFHQYFAQY